MNVTTLGIDLAKAVFQLHGVDEHDQVRLAKPVSRKHLLPFLANLPPCLVGLEACGGAHYWAREIQKRGHTVKLIAPQFVKPYVQGNKTDGNDAAAICEAVSRPHMHFVPINSLEQQDVQALHRVREQLIKNRTALANQIRGLLNEYLNLTTATATVFTGCLARNPLLFTAGAGGLGLDGSGHPNHGRLPPRGGLCGLTSALYRA